MSAIAIQDERLSPRKPVTGKTAPDNYSDLSHDNETDMPKDDDELRQLLVAVLSQQVNGAKKQQQWPAWIASGAAALALVFSVSGARWTNANESDLKERLAVLTEKLTQSETRQVEFRRDSERNYLLMDERYRQLSIALESRGIRLPTK